MQFETLQRDLQIWLKDSIDRGCSAEVIEQSMRTAGYQPKFARKAVDLAMHHFAVDTGGVTLATRTIAAAVNKATAAVSAGQAAIVDPAVSAQPDARASAGSLATSALLDGAVATPVEQAEEAAEVPVPTHSSEILAASPNSIETSDRKVNILFALNEPRIVLFGGLLSDEECDEMVRLSRGKLARSSVVNAATGDYDVHPDRTSEGTHFQRAENELITRIERRIAELVSCPLENGEPIQILFYQPGAQYRPHFDFFDPALPGNDKVLEMGGQRIATLVMYLNDVAAGGSTVFPEVGLDVLPRKGNAVYFAYTTEDGRLDRRSLHGGSPVSDGEKWIATKWLRQRPYVGPSA